jgi:hypothetical protein
MLPDGSIPVRIENLTIEPCAAVIRVNYASDLHIRQTMSFSSPLTALARPAAELGVAEPLLHQLERDASGDGRHPLGRPARP